MMSTRTPDIDPTVAERFTTTFPNGIAVPGFITLGAKSLVLPGHWNLPDFADHANRLLALSICAGWLRYGDKLYRHWVLPDEGFQCWTRPETDPDDGTLLLEWNITSENDGVIPVTLTEV